MLGLNADQYKKIPSPFSIFRIVSQAAQTTNMLRPILSLKTAIGNFSL